MRRTKRVAPVPLRHATRDVTTIIISVSRAPAAATIPGKWKTAQPCEGPATANAAAKTRLVFTHRNGGRRALPVEARSLFCYFAVRYGGHSIAGVASFLGMTPPAAGYAVERGERVAREKGYAF